MKNLTFLLFILCLLSCNNSLDNKQEQEKITLPNKEEYKKSVLELESKLRKEQTISDSLGTQMAKAYATFAFTFPQDSLSPFFLFKAAEVAMAIHQYQQALVYYETICLKYEDFTYITESLYLQGFIYDNYLNNDEKAKTIYLQTIEKYPSHQLSDDAKASIEHLGKSDEELIREFEKKNKEKI